MRAAWYEKVGDAKDVLQVGQIDDPTPDSNEVLISVKTSGINPSDVKIRAGARGELQFSRVIPHSDGAGTIIEVGKDVNPESNTIDELPPTTLSVPDLITTELIIHLSHEYKQTHLK